MDNLHLIQLAQYEKPAITEERNRDWVGIGEENDYYQCLIDAYMNSTTNQAVINGIVNQVYGKGIDATDSNEKPEQYALMKGLLKSTDLRNICQDLKLLGEASLQVSYKGNKISSITHFPRETLRAEKMNDKGEIKNYYYAPDWTEVNQNTQLTKLPVFGSKGTGNEIYIIKRYVTGYYYYSPADYNYAYATLEDEIANYLINDTQNGFSGTKVVNFNNGVPDREKQVAIKNDVMNKLTGTHGEKVIIAFNNNAENKTSVEDIPLNNAPQHYEYLSTECSKKIMLTHRVTSPLLIGLRDLSGGGLGNNQDEIITAQRLFTNTTIKPYQDLITECLDEILRVNNISLNLYFKTIEPLEFKDLSNISSEEREEEETGEKKEDDSTELELLQHKFHNHASDEELDKALQGLMELGENEEELLKNYTLLDTMEVDYENEEKFNKILELASTGRAYPNARSLQDGTSKQTSQEGVKFLVRYQYAPLKTQKNSREFCIKMVNAEKVYRKEDIIKMGNMKVNKGFGVKGADTYSIWLYKGGARCSHKWFRKTYMLKDGRKSTISTGGARSRGFKPPVNPQKVPVAPKDMPNEGFVNKPKSKK